MEKISFILTYCTVENDKHLLLDIKKSGWLKQTDSDAIYQSTINVIHNINKYCRYPHEIILVDNSDTWKPIDIDNLTVIKGLQSLTKSQLKRDPYILEHNDYKMCILEEFTDINNLTMHVSLGMYYGTKHASGDYIVLQHNDFYYHGNHFKEMIKELNQNYAYISADNKKVWMGSYAGYSEVRKLLGEDVKFSPFDGGYVRTEFGFADMYFFMCKKEFFDDYDIDWKYGDSNHGATLHCINNDWKYLHLRPYYDNPNFPTADETQHTYYLGDKKFGTHLKGGISENRMSNKITRDKWLQNL